MFSDLILFGFCFRVRFGVPEFTIDIVPVDFIGVLIRLVPGIIPVIFQRVILLQIGAEPGCEFDASPVIQMLSVFCVMLGIDAEFVVRSEQIDGVVAALGGDPLIASIVL